MMNDTAARRTLELKRLLLLQPVWTVAAAESLTCGNVQALLGSVSGSSAYFAGGVTAYTLEQKVRLLGVDAESAAPVHAVSKAAAEQMARGVANLFGADLGVATTGYAEPAPARGVSHPCAWWAVCLRGDAGLVVRSGFVELPGADRHAAQHGIAEHALSQLLGFVAEERNRQ